MYGEKNKIQSCITLLFVLFVFDPHIKIIILKPWNTNKWHIIKSTNIYASLESQPTD